MCGSVGEGTYSTLSADNAELDARLGPTPASSFPSECPRDLYNKYYSNSHSSTSAVTIVLYSILVN